MRSESRIKPKNDSESGGVHSHSETVVDAANFSPEFKAALQKFNEALDHFPVLRGRMKTEILEWVADTIELQKNVLPLMGAQVVMIFLIKLGLFDEQIHQLEQIAGGKFDEIFSIGMATSFIMCQAIFKARDKISRFLEDETGLLII